jgi:hypothetical protein
VIPAALIVGAIQLLAWQTLTGVSNVKYASRQIRSKQIILSHIMLLTAGAPQQMPGFRVMPGMEAIVFVGHLAGINDHVYISKNPRPRLAANTPGPGAIVLSGNAGTGGNASQFNLDGDVLSQWFVDSDGADQLNIVIYGNREESFV